MADYIYDTETFPNVHLLGVICTTTGERTVLEISERKDERHKIKALFDYLARNKHRMVGFNNIGYDIVLETYLITELMYMPRESVNQHLYRKSQQVIKSNGFEHQLWESDWPVDQVDVYKISHFDNKARATGLKDLEYAMRAEYIVDLPFDFNKPVPVDGIDTLADYMINHDCVNTLEYYRKIEGKMAIREEYSKRLGINVTNFNDTKLGKMYTQIRIEDTGYNFKDNKGQKKQTPRKSIDLSTLVFPFIKFYTPEFDATLRFLKSYTITKTKEVFNDLPTEMLGDLRNYTTDIKRELNRAGKHFPERVKSLNVKREGLIYKLGTGGLHACVEPCHATTDNEWTILDVDVTSYYPSIIIDHEVYPKHIGAAFSKTMAKMKTERISYAKGTMENAMLKLALNGTFGDLNSKFSVFYDPAASMQVTVNGQLMLLMLVELLTTNPFIDIIMLQCNTDGITFKMRRKDMGVVKSTCAYWENLTKMQLEHVEYDDMWISNVNNYAAKYAGVDKYKYKGAEFAYQFEENDDWAKDFSFRVVQKAAVAYLTQGVPVADFVENHDDTYDFTGRAKVQRSHRLLLDGGDQQRISRYYFAKDGGELTKEMPPLKEGGKVRSSVMQPTGGRKVAIINDTTYVDRDRIDYSFYIEKAEAYTSKITGRVV